MFLLLLPRDFVPEDYGWEPPDVKDPHVHQIAMVELNRYGFVSTQWPRWETPFLYPACLRTMGYDAQRRQFRAGYSPPLGSPPDTISRAALRERFGYTGDLTDTPAVSA